MHGWYRGAQEPRPQAAPAPNRSIAPGPRAREKSRYLRGEWSQHLGIVLQVFGSSRLFNLHIAKLFGIEDFATLQALDKLGVFVPGNDPDFGMFAGGCHRSRDFVHYSNPAWMHPFRPRAASRSWPWRGGSTFTPAVRIRFPGPLAGAWGLRGAGLGVRQSGIAIGALERLRFNC